MPVNKTGIPVVHGGEDVNTLYKKVGKRYYPCAEHEEWDSYPAGAHLVV